LLYQATFIGADYLVVLAIDAKAEPVVIILQFGYDVKRPKCSADLLEYVFAGQFDTHSGLERIGAMNIGVNRPNVVYRIYQE